MTISAQHGARATLEEVVQKLAQSHALAPDTIPSRILFSRTAEMPAWLERVKQYCLEPEAAHLRAVDWLLDNDYRVLRAIRQIEEDLPWQFYRRLPVLADDTKLPRIYALACAVLDATRHQLSPETIVSSVLAYQNVSTLTIAELWALPSMLRLACLSALADAFQTLNPDLRSPIEADGFTIAHRRDDPTERVSRSITNLGVIHSIEWPDVVDQTSRVEAILREDPAGIYARMDFDTRDRYRRAVEELASGSRKPEDEVASEVVALSKSPSADDRGKHVGNWLVGDGLAELEARLGYKIPSRLLIRRLLKRNAHIVYATALLAISLAAFIVPVVELGWSGASLAVTVGAISLSLLPVTVLSIAIVHRLATVLASPRILPKLDFRRGFPPDCPTAVVVPLIIADADEVPAYLEHLEIRMLSNPDPMLRYVLLTDPIDADLERLPGDEAIENALVAGIRELNSRYGAKRGGRFFLMHRARQYNPAEGCWMAWERKRGKLEQFNEFILGESSAKFVITEGRIEALRETRFVITLDDDTTLPPETAARLVGTMAHPLNRAAFDPESGRVLSGYTIIQPRIEILPQAGSVSLFCRLLSGDSAIDIYSRAVSDVYQDLFGSGIFVGKGIYDVAAFQRSLAGQVPENAILSHDLFEGIHGRAGLASDIILYESYPSTYPQYAMRLHRWVRGDWQLLPWLGRRVPMADGSFSPNPLSGLDRWKIIDNLRRSLISPALLIFFIGGWLILPGNPWLWTGLAAAAPGVYWFSELLIGFARDIRRGLVRDISHRLVEGGGRWFLSITFLVSDTIISIDAIARTLWRLSVSRRHLLQWRTASHVSLHMREHNGRRATWGLMWPSPMTAFLFGTSMAFFSPGAFLPAFPILTLWFIAPEIAYRLGKPRTARRESLDDEDRGFLLRAARRSWLYFETFVGPGDNWLPPDNYQEEPNGEVAHRTSPTNIGLYLTSACAALEFGFIGMRDFSLRSRDTLDAIDRMKAYRGHILNWYDTRTLDPLEPHYVSTVDSGNLAICLIVLKQVCTTAASRSPCGPRMWDGLACAFDILIFLARKLDEANSGEFDRCEEAFRTAIRQVHEQPGQARAVLDRISSELFQQIETAVSHALAGTEAVKLRRLADVQIWLERFHHHFLFMQRDLETFQPWLRLLDRAPAEKQEMAGRVRKALATENGDEADRSAELALQIVRAEITRAGEEAAGWLNELEAAIGEGTAAQEKLRKDLLDIAERAESIAFGMDFSFLYDPEVRLFRIGYNESTGQLDANHYDLLGTEARLASFFAIAKHDVPVEHWFFLGRPVTRLKGKPSILSWNGSMFEYLMPPMFLPGQRDTLLGESEAVAVSYQRSYAAQRGVPWGISESAFAVTDADGNYQYRAFGAPGLGMRRGLTEDLVIAPYASALALCCWPKAAVQNLKRLSAMGARGVYGYYDAIDFTPDRVPEGKDFVPVRTYMAHHHGMTIGAIANALTDDLLVRSVLAHKRMHTVELLLQERIPWDAPIERGRLDEHWKSQSPARVASHLAPWVPSRGAAVPQMQMIGNGSIAAWISEAGAGRLSWNEEALTRWLPDPTLDDQGYWIYVRDADTGNMWSVGRQPCGRTGTDARVVFHQHMVEMFRRDEGIAIHLEATVSVGDDIDVRRVTVINEGETARTIEFTSYAEVALAKPVDDERHPAFSKLFVGSSFVPGQNGLLFERRSRRPETRHAMLLHKLLCDDPAIELAGHETDRARFVGRNGNMRRPAGLDGDLSGTTGWTLDAIMALRARVKLDPLETKQFAFLTIAGGSYAEIMEAAERHASVPALELVFRSAARESARLTAKLEIEPDRLPEMQALASLLVLPHPSLRQAAVGVEGNRFGQPNLWQFGLSGDLPILLVRMESDESSGLLEFLIRAQRLWRNAGLAMDLVVLRSERSSYEEPLRERIVSILRDTQAYGFLGRNGGIHLLSSIGMAPDLRRGLEAAAHVVLDDDGAPLAGKLDRVLEQRASLPEFTTTGIAPHPPAVPVERPSNLLFDNGFGGFDPDSGDYVIYLDDGRTTPAPWCNVLANDNFGTIVSESGLGFTWAVNSGENRLTPWSNDQVADRPGEILYLRDEETAEYWTVTPAPLGRQGSCMVRHGAGYSRWSRRGQGLEQELLVFVPDDDPVKIARLRLTNQSDRVRRITATYYAEWLLGALASRNRPHIACQYDPSCHAIIANNAWNPEFAERMAFLTASEPPHSLTGDRHDFLGREAGPDNPAAMRHWDLGQRFTPGGDVCAAYQIHLDVTPGTTADVHFVLGQGANREEARTLIARWTDRDQVEEAFDRLGDFWAERLHAVTVRTPDTAFDLMTNRWLPYQTISSRLMARAGFYQAGGAFGFRDQLQDVLALLHSDPRRARRQILEAAGHQFEDGTALHWWHPPEGRGVKTRCSDDYIWLAYATARYVRETGDRSILDAEIPFLAAPPLRPEEHDRYALFETGGTDVLFNHCSRALNRMMEVGAHGLPLIGTGDWNDGMDRVGVGGAGESLWLAWFQIATIDLFAPLATARRGASDSVRRWREHSEDLRQAINEFGWDGDWFIRAFDDTGEAWGSKSNDECRIDSIAQSWGVIAGDGDKARVRRALASASERLVLADERLVLLLAPPFHENLRDPGYIKAYPPGIRENGGQYTHAAAWMGHAHAGIGDGDEAWRVFDIINPIRRSNEMETARHYRREPYVLPGDVGGPGQNLGRGGWTWYTGAAGWTWQLAVAGILGVRLRNGAISIDPCLPRDWGGAQMTLAGKRGTIFIEIEDPDMAGSGVVEMRIDGTPGRKRIVRFPGRNRKRSVVVKLGKGKATD